MEQTTIPGTDIDVTRVALGTWAIGGWMWGGQDEADSIRTIHAALDKGITLIDTAPVYGFGKSEETVGKAVTQWGRDKVHLATKVGLEWYDDGTVVRNSTPKRIRKEIEDSLVRLNTDYIDLYQVHWPDPLVPFQETAAELKKLLDEGLVRAVGVSNYAPEQMALFREACPLAGCQPPYNIFEREIEHDVMPYCQNEGIMMLTYGALCRGMLSGKMQKDREFTGDDLRQVDPKFQQPRFDRYLDAVDKLTRFADEKYSKSILALAVRYILDKGVQIALWGGRKPHQMDPLPEIFGWSLSDEDLKMIDDMVANSLQERIGPDFMAPPSRDRVGQR